MNRRQFGQVAVAAALLGTAAVLPVLAHAGSGPRWAVVSASGQLLHGNGVASARRLPSSTGAYQVTFRGDVSRCAYTGAGAGDPVQVTVASRAGNDNAVYVETRDATTGALSNAPFRLVAHCPGNGLFAVVGEDGALARGARVLSSTRLSAGSYVVRFARSVSGCAIEATIGTTGIGVVPTPGVVSVAPVAADRRAVAVQVVARGGGPVDQPFHLSVTCR
jgi:hypothetical protein